MGRSSRLRALAFLGACLLTQPAAPAFVAAAEPSVVDEVQDLMQMSAGERRRLDRGEVASFPVTENSERELAVGLAMLVSAPLTQVADYLASGQLIAQDASISDFGTVPDEVPSGALAGPRFTGGERAEAGSFLEASPGTRFNLSPDEIEALRTLRDSAGSSAGTSAVEKASAAYQRILHQRVQAYRHGGLAAIAPYARADGALRDPSIDLRLAAADAERLGPHGRELSEALLRYPADQPPQMVSQIYWIKRRIQRRPHLSLLHRIVARGPDSVLHIERFFYAGHSFNASAILTGALAHPDGAVLLCTSRVSTDEILGVGSQMKRAIARAQLRDDMRTRLDRLRASLTRPVSVESP